MREFPPELIYFLIFIALFLFQHLRKWLTRQVEKGAPAEAAPPEPEAYPASFDLPIEQTAPAAWSASPISANDFGRRPPAPAPAPVPPRRPRRFSRQSLFGTPQDVRKGVVIATILGPCRALEPSGSEPGTEPPRESTRRA